MIDLSIFEQIVASKFSALVMALLSIYLIYRFAMKPLIEHLIDNIRARRQALIDERAGLVKRMSFLERQVLGMAEAETDCVSLGAASVMLLSQSAVSGRREAAIEQFQLLQAKYAALRETIKARHTELKEHFDSKQVVR